VSCVPVGSSQVVCAFDLIHRNLWASPVVNVSGYKYYLVILQDCTHYSWTFLLCHKSDTFPTLSLSLLLMCSHNLVVPSGVSNATMDVSLTTSPPTSSFSLTVSSFGCRVPTHPHRMAGLSA
jgi:hypothetical protein